jgi:hypothetical protein
MMGRPAGALEDFVARSIPPACREEVLGDLCEKYKSPLQHLFLAARTVLFAILSRLCRISGPAFVLTDPVLIYAGFLLDAWIGDGLPRDPSDVSPPCRASRSHMDLPAALRSFRSAVG